MYTTQPLELLNALGFENLKNDRTLNRDLEFNSGDGGSIKSVDYDGGTAVSLMPAIMEEIQMHQLNQGYK